MLSEEIRGCRLMPGQRSGQAKALQRSADLRAVSIAVSIVYCIILIL